MRRVVVSSEATGGILQGRKWFCCGLPIASPSSPLALRLWGRSVVVSTIAWTFPSNMPQSTSRVDRHSSLQLRGQMPPFASYAVVIFLFCWAIKREPATSDSPTRRGCLNPCYLQCMYANPQIPETEEIAEFGAGCNGKLPKGGTSDVRGSETPPFISTETQV